MTPRRARKEGADVCRTDGNGRHSCLPGAGKRARPTASSWPPRAKVARMREDRLELLSDIETTNDVEVTLGIDLFEVIQQPAPATDQHQQTATTCKVTFVTLEVSGQAVDPGGQDGDLDLGGTGVGFAPLVLPDQFCFPLFGNSHLLPRLLDLGWLGDASTGSTLLLPRLQQLCLKCVSNNY
jgi:hypothetical protein